MSLMTGIIIREYYAQFSIKKLDNLDEMGKFLVTNKLSNVIQRNRKSP